MTTDLDHLEAVAKAATQDRWNLSGKQTVKAGTDRWIAKALWNNGAANAAHIVAFDPQTCLDLIKRLRSYEATS